ncbi:unnamed protein product [Phytomonas sp. EM1]|nr:unnamed protein product [Phytomonas sp. EM1]|eukprot:CCW60065.1 unnamed protein product [Phytomonas sp. isolate EM1]
MTEEDVEIASSFQAIGNTTSLRSSCGSGGNYCGSSATHMTELPNRYHLDPRMLFTPAQSQWTPTRLSSPFCVLSAYDFQDDFYINTLSWGHEQIALALRHDLLFFHPASPRQRSATICVSDIDPAKGNDASGSPSNTSRRQPTAVAVCRHNDESCFLGLSGGGVELFQCTEHGSLARTNVFTMPPSPYETLAAGMRAPLLLNKRIALSEGVLLSRVSKALSASMSSVSSVCGIATSGTHPWLGVVATAGGELLTLDARSRNPCTVFGGNSGLSRASLAGGEVPVHLPRACCSYSPRGDPEEQDALAAHTFATAGDSLPAGQALRRVQWASDYLKHHDRLCSVAWSVNGSLIATGSDMGTVKLWSLQNPRSPVQVIPFDQHSTIKALCFHPHNPYELLIGGDAGNSGLRVYNVLTVEPQLMWSTNTTAQTTQAQYSPDGGYIVTAQGTCASSPTLPEMMAEGVNDESRTTSSMAHSYRGPQLQFNFADDSMEEDPEVCDRNLGRTGGGNQGMGWLGTAPRPGAATRQQAPPSYSLVVWRKPKRDSVELCPCNLLSREEKAIHSPSSSMDQPHRHCRLYGKTAETSLPLHFQYAMVGHRARPLLACPFSPSSYEGCMASVAGGGDSNIRFWRVFQKTNRPGGRYGSIEETSSRALRSCIDRDHQGDVRELR